MNCGSRCSLMNSSRWTIIFGCFTTAVIFVQAEPWINHRRHLRNTFFRFSSRDDGNHQDPHGGVALADPKEPVVHSKPIADALSQKMDSLSKEVLRLRERLVPEPGVQAKVEDATGIAGTYIDAAQPLYRVTIESQDEGKSYKLIYRPVSFTNTSGGTKEFNLVPVTEQPNSEASSTMTKLRVTGNVVDRHSTKDNDAEERSRDDAFAYFNHGVLAFETFLPFGSAPTVALMKNSTMKRALALECETVKLGECPSERERENGKYLRPDVFPEFMKGCSDSIRDHDRVACICKKQPSESAAPFVLPACLRQTGSEKPFTCETVCSGVVQGVARGSAFGTLKDLDHLAHDVEVTDENGGLRFIGHSYHDFKGAFDPDLSSSSNGLPNTVIISGKVYGNNLGHNDTQEEMRMVFSDKSEVMHLADAAKRQTSCTFCTFLRKKRFDKIIEFTRKRPLSYFLKTGSCKGPAKPRDVVVHLHDRAPVAHQQYQTAGSIGVGDEGVCFCSGGFLRKKGCGEAEEEESDKVKSCSDLCDTSNIAIAKDAKDREKNDTDVAASVSSSLRNEHDPARVTTASSTPSAADMSISMGESFVQLATGLPLTGYIR